MGVTVDARYTPHALKMLWILLLDNAYGLYLCLVGFPAFFLDWLVRVVRRDMPSCIDELVDVETYSRLSGRVVTKVEYAKQREQHAHSTDRAWLRVRYADESHDTLVFAKCQAKDVFVRALMSVFDVYRNELNAYANIDMPVTTPKVHIAKWTRSRFVLVMEDLSAQGVEFPNIWSKHVDRDLAQQVLSTLAKIHAKFWGKNVPPGVWRDGQRPYFGIGMGFFTLWMVDRRCRPGLIPPAVHKVFEQALWHWVEYRAYQSRAVPLTMCHGDTHMGNFYIKKDGSIGTFDFQVLCEENPLRDVCYFLSSSYDPDELERDEESLIRFYLDRLREYGAPRDEIPTYEQALDMYRMQTFYALYAFVFSGGFASLMDAVQTNCGVGRIVRVMERLDAGKALYEMLDGKR